MNNSFFRWKRGDDAPRWLDDYSLEERAEYGARVREEGRRTNEITTEKINAVALYNDAKREMIRSEVVALDWPDIL